jgi:HK97 family phage major capsid protein
LTGQFVPVLREANGGWQLLTRPVLFTEKLPAVGDKGDILLADFSQYAIGVRKEITIEKSGHVYFMSDETAWRAITRVDGQGRWNKAYTPANGATQSWCVCLAAR